MSRKKILIIEDDEVIRSNILELLEEEGFEGMGASDGKEGVASALAQRPDLILCDIMMPVMDGHRVLRALRDYPETAAVPFIFLTARAQRSDIRSGMNLGADDYITKPFTRSEVLDAIRTRLDRTKVLASMSDGAGASDGSGELEPAEPPPGMIVASAAMQAVHERAIRAAQSDLSVLLLGETGVGKDVLAHAIHKASPRASRPFIPLNTVALAENLLESELFGHEKGAFTGAVQAKPGLFESAEGGTVFLDEIGDLPSTTQVKLLRVLEDRQVMRVGGRTFRKVDVRFVAATNRDLEQEAGEGRFRQDLFFRVGGVVLTVPPLRERPDDVEPLARRFASNMCRQLRRSMCPALGDETLAVLERWKWPGNVRELRNVVEHAVAMCDSEMIRPEHLPEKLRDPDAPKERNEDAAMEQLRSEMDALERQRIEAALERCGGNQTKAAKLLGISRRTLLNRLDEYGLPRPRKGS